MLVDDPMWDASQFDVLGATRATFAEIAPGARETLAKTLGRFDAGVASALVGKTYDGVVMDGTVTRACGVDVFDDDEMEAFEKLKSN